MSNFVMSIFESPIFFARGCDVRGCDARGCDTQWREPGSYDDRVVSMGTFSRLELRRYYFVKRAV
jgi:hypothetical protein